MILFVTEAWCEMVLHWMKGSCRTCTTITHMPRVELRSANLLEIRKRFLQYHNSPIQYRSFMILEVLDSMAASKCVHKGCNKMFTQAEEACQYHPG